MEKDYLSGLNDPQTQAVLQMDGPVMIIAGAGSGKTRVLTHRIAHLIHNKVDPFNVLALTFTNKAAREMKSRITALSNEDAKNLWMGTFHSVFARILRSEASFLNYTSSFTIYDRDDSLSLVKTIIKEKQLDDSVYKASVVLNRISSAKNNLINPIDYSNDIDYSEQDRISGRPLIGEIYSMYNDRLFKANAMDFDDLLINTYILLKQFPEVLYRYQTKFKYLLVDEFQDTNLVQYAIVKKLAAQHENITVVGDDSQSIYAFRGANIQNILNFSSDYPDLKTFKLEQNYRSTINIVEAANSLIDQNKNRLPKKVWTQNESGNKIKVIKSYSDNDEANFVANQIFDSHLQNQIHYDQFAILYRTNAQSRSIEEALRKKNIPYRIYGGMSFYNRKEIKDMMAYFRLAVNPKDEEALKRVINYPKREIGDTSVDKMVVYASQQNKSLWEVVTNINMLPVEISSRTKAKVDQFASKIMSFNVQVEKLSAYDLAMGIANESGLLRELHNDKTPEGISHFENIQELLNSIQEFTLNGHTGLVLPEEDLNSDKDKKNSLDVYLQQISLLTTQDNDSSDQTRQVQVMTVHSAKGLEFKTVIVTGMEENLFPSQLSIYSREDLEEERRLFYVAMTRAEKQLYLSYAVNRFRWGKAIICEPSRFLNEIDSTYLELSQDAFSVRPSQVRLSEDRQDVFKKPSKSFASNHTQASITVPSNFKKIAKAKIKDSSFEGDDPSLIMTGMEVEHEKFGKGKVLNIEGTFPNSKATIFFNGAGQKQLLLKFAKLKCVR